MKALLFFVISLIASALPATCQNLFQVKRFVYYTHHGRFDGFSVQDAIHGFPRLEWEVWPMPGVNWTWAKVAITATGEIPIKKNAPVPVEYRAEIMFDLVNSNAPAFYVKLPESFIDAVVTSVTTTFLDGVIQLPAGKPVLAKTRIINLGSESPHGSYSDDFLSIDFEFSSKSNSLLLTEKNLTTEPIITVSGRNASVEFEVKDLAIPPVRRFLHYSPESKFGTSIQPGGTISDSIEIQDRKACGKQANASIEIEPDAICKTDGPLFRKYLPVMQEGYVIVRAIIPILVAGDRVREYIFTFVITLDSPLPKKKNPDDVKVVA